MILLKDPLEVLLVLEKNPLKKVSLKICSIFKGTCFNVVEALTI